LGWDFRDLHGIEAEIIDVIGSPERQDVTGCSRDLWDVKMLPRYYRDPQKRSQDVTGCSRDLWDVKMLHPLRSWFFIDMRRCKILG
jgi:hypothetical protein